MENLLVAMWVLAVFGFQAVIVAQGDDRTDYFLDEIKKTKEQVDKYVSPKEQIYLVDQRGEAWLMRAISPSVREEWIATTSMNPSQKKLVNDALNSLSNSAKKKVPLYKPEDKRFAFGSPEEKEMMTSKIPGLENFIIHKIGLADQNWTVVNNDLGTPKHRLKNGYVWFTYKGRDHAYCHIYQINIYQRYQGGGNYGASYGNYETQWLSGCP